MNEMGKPPCSLLPGHRKRMNTAMRLFIWATVVVLTAVGCNRPRYEQERQRHNESIDKTIRAYQRGEEQRQQNIRDTLSIMERNENMHAEKLSAMVERINKAMRERDEKWQRMRPVWRSRIRGELRGKPENIPDTSARLFN